jgi:hypothetical protein
MQGTGIGLEQAGDDVEDRGLAAARWADDADEVAFVDGKGEVVEHADLTGFAGKGFSDIANAELGGGWLHRRFTGNLYATPSIVKIYCYQSISATRLGCPGSCCLFRQRFDPPRQFPSRGVRLH